MAYKYNPLLKFGFQEVSSDGDTGETTELIDWEEEAVKPVLNSHYLTGDFVQNAKHIVTTKTISNKKYSKIDILGENKIPYNIDNLNSSSDLYFRGKIAYSFYWDDNDFLEIKKYDEHGNIDTNFSFTPISFDFDGSHIGNDNLYLWSGKTILKIDSSGAIDASFSANIQLYENYLSNEILEIHEKDSFIYVVNANAEYGILKIDITGVIISNFTQFQNLAAGEIICVFFDENFILYNNPLGFQKIFYNGQRDLIFDQNVNFWTITQPDIAIIFKGDNSYYLQLDTGILVSIYKIDYEGIIDEAFSLNFSSLFPDPHVEIVRVFDNHILCISTTTDGVRVKQNLILTNLDFLYKEFIGNSDDVYIGRAFMVENNLYVYDYNDNKLKCYTDFDFNPIFDLNTQFISGQIRDVIQFEDSFVIVTIDNPANVYTFYEIDKNGLPIKRYEDYIISKISKINRLEPLTVESDFILQNDGENDAYYLQISEKGEYSIEPNRVEVNPVSNKYILLDSSFLENGDKIIIHSFVEDAFIMTHNILGIESDDTVLFSNAELYYNAFYDKFIKIRIISQIQHY
jgi:hypothetical protein